MFNLQKFSHTLKNTTILFSILAFSFSLSFNLPKISVNAETNPEYLVVTHPNGINIRDKNCNIIDQVGYGEGLIRNSNISIVKVCNVGTQSLEMINYTPIFGNYANEENRDIFVAKKFVQSVISGQTGSYTTIDKVRLNSPNGDSINIRDGNCQKIVTLPNGTYSEKAVGFGGGFNVCKVSNKFYLMIPFIYQGKIRLVAEILTKYE